MASEGREIRKPDPRLTERLSDDARREASDFLSGYRQPPRCQHFGEAHDGLCLHCWVTEAERLREALEAVRDTAHDDERVRIVDEALARTSRTGESSP